MPLYEVVLKETAVGATTSVLDIGCGSGKFCEMAARRGAQVSGLDASESLLAIAHERVVSSTGKRMTGNGVFSVDLVTGAIPYQGVIEIEQ